MLTLLLVAWVVLVRPAVVVVAALGRQHSCRVPKVVALPVEYFVVVVSGIVVVTPLVLAVVPVVACFVGDHCGLANPTMVVVAVVHPQLFVIDQSLVRGCTLWLLVPYLRM